MVGLGGENASTYDAIIMLFECVYVHTDRRYWREKISHDVASRVNEREGPGTLSMEQ